MIPGIKELLANKGYGTNAIRAFLKQRGIGSVIPGKSDRKKKIRHDKEAYKGRNYSVERCFASKTSGALQPATIAQNFFSALCLVAMVAYWI